MTPISGGSATGSATSVPRRRRPGNSLRSNTKASGTPMAAARRHRRRARSRGSPRAPTTRPAGARTRATCASVQCGAPKRLGERQDERIADQPEEQQRQQRGGEPLAAAGHGSLGKDARPRAVRRRDDEDAVAVAGGVGCGEHLDLAGRRLEPGSTPTRPAKRRSATSPGSASGRGPRAKATDSGRTTRSRRPRRARAKRPRRPARRPPRDPRAAVPRRPAARSSGR